MRLVPWRTLKNRLWAQVGQNGHCHVLVVETGLHRDASL